MKQTTLLSERDNMFLEQGVLRPLIISGIFEYRILASSAVSHLLLESPWLLSIACLVAAFTLMVAAQRYGRGRRALTSAGIVAMMLAGAILGLAKMVTTDRELLVARTQLLVTHSAPVEGPSLARMIDSDARIISSGGRICFDGAWLVKHLTDMVNRYGVVAHEVRQLGAHTLDSGQGLSWIDLHTTLTRATVVDGLETTDSAVPSKWKITWRQDRSDGQWYVTQIQCTKLMQIQPDCNLWGR